MRYDHLTEAEVLEALSDSHEALAALAKYQKHLSTGTGLPKDDTARVELMVANLRLAEKIRAEITALEASLASRN